MDPSEAAWMDQLTWGQRKEERRQARAEPQGCRQVCVSQVKKEEAAKETEEDS